ncbi:MAG: hypothetical protein AB3N33_13070 [Puniceicoccaceae bacterium]
MKIDESNSPASGSDSSVASNSTLVEPSGPISGQVLDQDGELWYEIQRVDCMDPFLMTLASDSDHWLFLLSNGGLTAGRINPDHALLPYYTQDKMKDLAGQSGSTTFIRLGGGAGAPVWAPFSEQASRDDSLHRNVRKNLYGNHIVLEEINTKAGLTCRVSWRPSERFGFVRKVEILNTGNEAAELEILDGLRNIMPSGLNQRFQNEFSILGDAYKQTELAGPANIGVYHLSSVPTDLASPMEALKASVAWQIGLEGTTQLLSETQVTDFYRTGSVTGETSIRGMRGAYLCATRMQIQPGESKCWYLCADVDYNSAKVEALQAFLSGDDDIIGAIETDCRGTGERLSQMLANADGLQMTADASRAMRHTSNTLFNLMRGGAFPTGYSLPVQDVVANVKHFNKEAAAELESLLEGTDGLTCYDPWDSDHPLAKGSPDLLRLLREYLPLSFSRRHGDPSRPWNRFSIEIKEADGSPRFYYQGNWRDIFQNWEALMHAYPEYAEAGICRFLNASTADGYNPYRVTKDGFDWEILEPSDPWANIGYWGDHQIIYLLRLLETSLKFHPGRLNKLLKEDTFVYAEVPYRIRSFEETYVNPRETVDYDTEAEERIEERVGRIGADGKVHHTRDGRMIHVTLLEKLLNPLLAKLSNFIPGGGIWMNTQRPEWNDANNALVGYGISVVTLGYVARYLRFLIDRFGEDLKSESFQLSSELADWLEQQATVFGQAPAQLSGEERYSFMQQLGEPATTFRNNLYDASLSGQKQTVEGAGILAFLENALAHADASLRENKRPDDLWHSYNLLRPDNGAAGIGHLVVMLEGQVSILSAGVLNTDEVLALLKSLQESDLYREDQDSFLLYPNKYMPAFLEKNRVSRAEAETIPLLAGHLESGSATIINPLGASEVAFNGDYNNVGDLAAALDGIECPEEDKKAVMELFEQTFNHHAFTGRSGTFFAYEGLGSIYWHMVSKLVLAVQENYCAIKDNGSPDKAESLLGYFRQFRDGLGVGKNPALYGAFPTDAYSHTPAHAGAQQPGMTGQVKEDILIRLLELGVHMEEGNVTFAPDMVEETEYLGEARTFVIPSPDGAPINLELEAGSLAFSFCRVPVIYQKGQDTTSVEILYSDDSSESIEGLQLPDSLSRELFLRTGRIRRITVRFP